MLCTSNRVLFEDQNFFINHISQGGVAQYLCGTVSMATHTQTQEYKHAHKFTHALNYVIDF